MNKALNLREAMKDYEKQYITNVLHMVVCTKGSTIQNKTKAAEILGMSVSSLYRKLKEHKICQ